MILGKKTIFSFFCYFFVFFSIIFFSFYFSISIFFVNFLFFFFAKLKIEQKKNCEKESKSSLAFFRFN